MRKTLKTAMAAACALLLSGSAMAYDLTVLSNPVMPEDGKIYYIYDAHADNGTTTEQTGNSNCRYAFRWDNNGTINGQHVKPYGVANGTVTLDNNYVWYAQKNEDNTFSFKNVGTNRWIKQSGCGTTDGDADHGTFLVEGTNVNALTVNKAENGVGTGSRWDGNGSEDFPMVYWDGSGHPIRFYEAVTNGEAYKIACSNAWNVTYTYTTPGNEDINIVKAVIDGDNAESNIPTVSGFFTVSGVASENKIVSENNKNFTLEGQWNYPVQPNHVYRVRIKPNESTSVAIKYVAADNKVMANQGSGEEIEAERFWYFKSADQLYDKDGNLQVTMHTLALGDEKGITYENVDNSKASLSEEMTVLTIMPTNWGQKQSTDAVIAFANGTNFANLRGNYFSTWKNSDALGNDGSAVRFMELTEDDYTAFAKSADAEAIAAAKANPTPEAINALLEAYFANPLPIALEAISNYPIGDKLGEFNNAEGNMTEVIANAQALMSKEDATDEEINAAVAALSIENLIINQPQAGHYYRLGLNGYYLSSTTTMVGQGDNQEERLSIEHASNANDLNNTSVFYYDGEVLATFPEGLVVGDLTNSYSAVLSTNEHAGKVSFAASAEHIGRYNVKMGERNMYHNDTAKKVDAGRTVDNQDGYTWELTEVTWLPVPHTADNAHLSICVPVDLNITAYDRALHHSGVISGNQFGKIAMTDETLPANTPAILEYKGGIEHGCIYFQITGYPTVEATAEEAPEGEGETEEEEEPTEVDTPSSLIGTSYLAIAKPAESNYFVVSNNHFVAHEGETIPANSAVLLVNENPAEEYEIVPFSTLSIKEVNAATGVNAIYDLQGRRVSKPTHGLYIINGVKTLVK